MQKSQLDILRASYKPSIPEVLGGKVVIEEGPPTQSVANQKEIQELFPYTYGLPVVKFVRAEGKMGFDRPINAGVLLSGGQAPGGHNVIAGLFDGLKRLHQGSRLFGFLMGPGGLVGHNYKELTADIIAEYRNTGGFDMIGSGRLKLETKEQYDKGLEILKSLNITALVVIGGDDSNTNACLLAEYYKSINAGVDIIGCPKTIDGDLKCKEIETSFGFDTASKVYSEVIGHVSRDCNSARKYWHIMKLMGRTSSHITLECALQTHPNICIISEEVEAKNILLKDIVEQFATVVAKRAEKGYNFGTAIIPEGLIESIPATKVLIGQLNYILEHHKTEFDALETVAQKREFVINKLSPKNVEVFSSFPASVASELLLDRDTFGNVNVSKIETEVLLVEMVKDLLNKWKKEGRYNGKFSPVTHFFGYEGRSAQPSNYDANYCYSLGYTASLLIAAGKTGYMASVRNTTAPAKDWIPGGLPIAMLMNMECRGEKKKPVIQKANVDLNGAPFKYFAGLRDKWAVENDYVYPGPIQYYGPSELCNQPTLTLKLEKGVSNLQLKAKL